VRSAVRAIAAVAVLATGAQGYYHFIHYPARIGPFRPIYEKFDLASLPGRTLPFYVSEPNGVRLAENDSFPSLLSHIRAAARAWNDVETSDLRIAFSGITTERTPMGSPSVEVLFEEVPPGVVAMGGPTIRAESNGVFVPIVKSVVILQPDLTARPSHTEAFGSTLVHEFGHALGLQHTFTSSVMSTATTRSTSKARPLTTDDIAAISVLYPRASFLQSTGAITGRVTLNGQGVNLASVVAIVPNGAAVSTLTNPDGTYRIEGLPPRGYYVYVHPLPPPIQAQTTPGGIVYPVDHEGNHFPEGQPFETVFYSSFTVNGVKEVVSATLVASNAGATTENINFDVRPRTGYSIHSVETRAYPGEIAVKPPYLSPGMIRPYVIATGSGLIGGSNPVQGLNVSVLGGANLSTRPLSTAPGTWIQIMFDPQNLLVSSDSARHLVFSANNDLYVLPSAFFHVERQPPQILTVAPRPDPRTVTVVGMNVTAQTRYLFDGVPAQLRSFEEMQGGARAVVMPPQAAPGHRAVVSAINSDGQSSLFLQNDAPPFHVYPADAATAATTLTLQPNGVPSGVETTIQIDSPNAQFVEGQVSVGFGTSDISVRRVWVVSPTRLLVNVAVNASAQLSIPTVTLVSGLQIMRQPQSFVVQGSVPRPFWMSSLYLNTVTGQPSVNPGSTVAMLIGASPVPATTANASVLLNDIRVPLLSVNSGQITFQIPASTPVGSLVVRVEIAGERSLPITIPVEAVSRPADGGSSNGTVKILAASSTAVDLVALQVSGLGSDDKVTVQIAGRTARLIAVMPDGDKHTVIFELPGDIRRGDTVQVTVSNSAGTSEPFSLRIGG
jgi:hypothetical protein